MTAQQTKPGGARRRISVRLALVVVLIIALLGSLLVNVLLYRQADRSYRELNEVRLDPYGLGHRFNDPDARAQNGDLVIVFLGDSRAEQWLPPHVPGMRFVNRGIFGQTTEQVRGRLQTQVLPLHPRVVVLQVGINDLKAIGLFPQRHDEIVRACKAHLHEIIQQCRDSGSFVIVTTVFPTGPVPLERRPYWSPAIERAVDEVNTDLRSIHSDGVEVLDAWERLQDQGRLRPVYAADTLH